MHPNRAFHREDRALCETLIDEIGFGMVFAQTPDGPRLGHAPLHSTRDGAVQFHLARGNALTRHLGSIVERHEARLGADMAWSLAEMPKTRFDSLLQAIVGFELEVRAWRSTLKLSQNKGDEAARVADALDQNGSPALAALMRGIAP
jgi:transcriptional regulator